MVQLGVTFFKDYLPACSIHYGLLDHQNNKLYAYIQEQDTNEMVCHFYIVYDMRLISFQRRMVSLSKNLNSLGHASIPFHHSIPLIVHSIYFNDAFE